jgi:serine/threonine protein kinase
MSFFEDLVELYSKIDFPEEYQDISKIDKAISWYYADQLKQLISATKSSTYSILELDIKNAFTTICNCWFDKESDFLKELNKIEEKKGRNIFIATNLRNTEYLHQLNMICKMIIFGVIFENGDAQILELKKDGAIIICDNKTENNLFNLSDSESELTKFILSNQFTIKSDRYVKYLRSNKTSYFWDGKELIVKGIYKYAPKKLAEIQKKLFNNEEIDHDNVLHIYSKDYFDIVVLNNLDNILDNYYLCTNGKYLTIDYKYESKLKNAIIDPKMYLKTFLYPILLSTKM